MRLELTEKRFGEARILGEIAFEIAPGEIVALLGPSGVGKTTLLRVIAGLDQFFEGRIEGDANIAMVFQEPTLLPWRSAEANLRIATGVDGAAAVSLLGEVELGGKAAAFPGQLSLGQQRRLALARALAAEPDLLLMDEPFASLDEATAARMRALTLRVLARRRIAALMTTHDVLAAAEMADRVVVLGGSPARLTGEARIAAPRSARDAEVEARRLRDLLL